MWLVITQMKDVYMPIQGFNIAIHMKTCIYKQFDVSMLEIMPTGLRMAFVNSCPKNDQYSQGRVKQTNLKKQGQQHHLSINICSWKIYFYI